MPKSSSKAPAKATSKGAGKHASHSSSSLKSVSGKSIAGKVSAKPAGGGAPKGAGKAADSKAQGSNAQQTLNLKKTSGMAKSAGKSQRSGSGQGASLGAHSSGPRRSVSSDICREVACEGLATSGGYCRLHYIKNWKKIQRKALILKEGKLNQYIEELVAKYPDKYIEAIRQDLANNREFSKVVRDLELDEGFDEFDSENENVDSLIDSIKRDIDDDEEVY